MSSSPCLPRRGQHKKGSVGVKDSDVPDAIVSGQSASLKDRDLDVNGVLPRALLRGLEGLDGAQLKVLEAMQASLRGLFEHPVLK